MLDELRADKQRLEEALADEQEQRSSVEEALQTERHELEQLRNHNAQLQAEVDRLKEIRKGGNFGKFVKVKEENERLKQEVSKAQSGMKSAHKAQNAMKAVRRMQARPSQPQERGQPMRRQSFNKR